MTPNPLSLSAVSEALRYACISRAGIAINAGGAATILSAGAIDYVNDGVIYRKTTLAAQAISTMANGGTAYVQPASTTVYYVLCLDSAGTVKTVQGSYSGQPMGVGRVDKGTGGVPDIPDGLTPFGMIKVVTAAANTFTLGTTALDAAGKTFTFYNLCVLPKTAP